MGARPEVAQLRSSTQVVKQFGVALKLGEVIGMQDDRLDVLRAVALDYKRLALLRLGRRTSLLLMGELCKAMGGR